MTKDSIELENVRLSYNKANGVLSLTSDDNRLGEAPMLLTLSESGDSRKRLIELFEAEDSSLKASSEELSYTATSSVASSADTVSTSDTAAHSNGDSNGDSISDNIAEDYNTRRSFRRSSLVFFDPRLLFPAGASYGFVPLNFDLNEAPATLIVGASGTGKSELLRALAQHALSSQHKVLFLDSYASGSTGLGLTDISENSAGRGLKACEAQLKALSVELSERTRALKAAGTRSWIEYDAIDGVMDPIFVFVDGLEALKDNFLLALLPAHATEAGVYLFATIRKSSDLEQGRVALESFGRTVLLGVAEKEENLQVLGADPKIASRLLSVPGRGVFRANDGDLTLAQFAKTRS